MVKFVRVAGMYTESHVLFDTKTIWWHRRVCVNKINEQLKLRYVNETNGQILKLWIEDY